MSSEAIEEMFFKAIKMKQNCFLTGAGGTGKTYLLNNSLKRVRRRIAVMATTGLAGLHLKAPTMHSFLGIGIHTKVEDLAKIKKKYKLWADIRERILSNDIFVVDEISMCRSDALELIDALMRAVTEIDKPFGGKQMIFVGDFLQLPPVVKREEDLLDFWAFQSKAWKDAKVKCFNLTEVKRQSDPQVVNALMQIRKGKVSPLVNAMFIQRVNAELEIENPIRLLAKNKQVHSINIRELDKLEGEKITIKGNYEYHPAVEKSEEASLWYQMSSSTRMEDELILKPNARIILTQNNKEAGYANGSMGTFLRTSYIIDTSMRKYENIKYALNDLELEYEVDKEDDYIIHIKSGSDTFKWIRAYQKDTIPGLEIIKNYDPTEPSYYHMRPVLEAKLDGHKYKTFIERATDFVVSSRFKNGNAEAENEVEFSQFPVKLAWAITIHKSQGMTLEYAEIDCKGIFGPAMLYVALSRVKSLSGLRLLNWDASLVQANYAALDFYQEMEAPEAA